MIVRLALLAALAAHPVAAQGVLTAEYRDPTTRYAHGVLGDDEEWGALVLELDNRSRLAFVLPEERVFEDLAPRLVDIDGDGANEALVVESHVERGARIAIYGADGLVVATDFIGTPNRWMAPVGVTDLNGDGRMDVVYVDRPHLAKTLVVMSYTDGQLVRLAEAAPYSNHRIGQNFISGGIRTCAGRAEIVVASGDWRGLVALSWDGQGLSPEIIGTDTSPAGFAAALACGG